MKKRLLSLLLVLAMVFSLMPAALAADKPSFQSFFESVPANAETEPGSPNSTNKWKVASLDGDYVLKSGGAGKSKANSTLQLTFTADAELTFEYKVSSEPKYDCFTITYDGAEKVKESGDLGWKTYTLSAESGKVLTLTYTKDSSGDKFNDCVYVRNFTAGKATVVTFHANGGVGADYTQNFYGQAALKLNAFTKADGVFAGWATTPDGEVAYTDGAKLNPTEAMDLYAVWTPAYTVTFAYNDGTTADTTVAIACDTAIGAGAIPQPTRTGYTFGGWFAGDTALTADTVIADDTTYTAAWTANTYTVQYLPNGGTGEMAAQTFTYDAEQALTANAFTRAGYDFRGWNTSASGSSVQYTDGAAVKNLSAENNAVVKLYAVWAGQRVQVTVNRNDGSEPTVRTGVVGYNYNYIYENGSARYNQIPDPTRTGYIFLGWFDAPEGGTEITNQTKFADATPVTLYAHWQEGITVHFDGNGYKGTISDKTVRKDAVGKNLPYLSEYSYPANKALDGWYTAKEGGERVTQDTVFTEPEITLYAHWRDYQYQVEFNVRYSDKSSVTGEMATVAVPFGVDYQLPACTFQREGYKFAGWSESSYGTTVTTVKYADQATIHRNFEDDDWGEGSEDNEIYKLYAVWTKDAFGIAFDAVAAALPADGTIRTAADQQVTLTASIVCNSIEGLTLTKAFTVTVAASQESQATLREQLQAKLDAGFAAYGGLRDAVTGEPLEERDGKCIAANDIHFPTTGDFGVDGKYTPVIITSSDADTIVPPGVNNAARVEVYRPLPGEDAKDVTVTVTIKDKETGISVSRDFVIAVQPLTQQEIDDELALMAEVKAHYFDGIRNGNTDPEHITGNLHAFREAYLNADGQLVWVYDVDDQANHGIVPSELPGWQASERWRLFRSTNPAVISHENLLVTRATEHKAVTIVSELSSETLGKYAARYPDNADFQALSHQAVSARLIVRGTAPTSDEPQVTTSTVTFQLHTDTEMWIQPTVVYDQPEGTTAMDVFRQVLTANGYTYEAKGSYVQAVIKPDGTKVAEFSKGPNSGWVFRVNGEFPDVAMRDYQLSDGDVIEVLFTANYMDEPGLFLPFTDVNNHWAYSAIKRVYNRGLMLGVSDTRFAPNQALSRAMLVTVLYRLADEPDVTADNPFTDVPAGQWYTNAVIWAAANGIVSGFGDGTFRPNAPATRAQAAVMLCGYAKLAGRDTTQRADLSAYADAAEIPSWALAEMQWANAAQLIRGRSDTILAPNAGTTRAEMAKILSTFIGK